jgi:hypothetical protein
LSEQSGTLCQKFVVHCRIAIVAGWAEVLRDGRRKALGSQFTARRVHVEKP